MQRSPRLAVVILLASLAVAIAPRAAAAKTLAIAVMPFRDLAGAKNPVGDGIRETVTSDLRSVPGVRVVERAEIEKVLNEQKVQLDGLEQDSLATMKLGKLIGADVMTVGAYQQVGRRIRLTARFVNVETGEVTGGAKVDGDTSDFLELQDRITEELLKSSKLQPQVVERFGRRARPKIHSLHAVELLGRAAEEKEAPMKRAILKEAVREEPDFSYATEELARLQKLIDELNAKQKAEQKVQAEAAKAAWEKAKTPIEKYTSLFMYSQHLREERRYNELIRLFRETAKEFDAAPQPAIPDAAATMFAQVVQLEEQIRRVDQATRDAATFTEKYAGSHQADFVKSALERIVERQKAIEEGKGKAEKEVAELNSEQKWDLCRIALEYDRASQFPEAERLYSACLEAGTHDRDDAIWALEKIALDAGDWTSARRYDAMLDDEFPTRRESMRSYIEMRLPVDD